MKATRGERYGLALALTAMCSLGTAGVLATAAGGDGASAQEPATGAPQETEFNPLKAEKNLEVGKYYLKKGNWDAAIDRLKDSIRYKSNFAEPHRLLGEAYEKKGNLKEAVAFYEKYLKILPGAEDADKVRKRVEKLTEKLEMRERKKPDGSR